MESCEEIIDEFKTRVQRWRKSRIYVAEVSVQTVLQLIPVLSQKSKLIKTGIDEWGSIFVLTDHWHCELRKNCALVRPKVFNFEELSPERRAKILLDNFS